MNSSLDDPVICGEFHFEKKCAFQMVLWNCIFYNFYKQKVSSQSKNVITVYESIISKYSLMQKSSQVISDVLSKLRPTYIEDCVLVLMQSFVCPQNMYRRNEVASTENTDMPRYRLTSSLRVEPLRATGVERDPLYEFFSLEYTSNLNKGILVLLFNYCL